MRHQRRKLSRGEKDTTQMKVSHQEFDSFTPSYPICFLKSPSMFTFPSPPSLAFSQSFISSSFLFLFTSISINTSIRFNIVHHISSTCRHDRQETTFILYLPFCILLLLSALPLVHNSYCQIFLDVDSNVDVGTDDSEEGICIKRSPTRMHDCSKVIDQH